jgi:ferredoxin-NADP reductase
VSDRLTSATDAAATARGGAPVVAASTTAALPRTETPRAGWHVGTVVAARRETPNATRLELDVEDWPGNAAGQHVDVRLTAPDGYSATRSYSIASSGPSSRVVLAVDKLPDGEVSPFLVEEVRAGDQLELHGPLGAYFVWRPAAETGSPRAVQLIAGGSGVVPLFAIATAHADAADPTPFRLLYSARTPADVYFADELRGLVAASAPLRLDLVYTRRTPDGWPVPAARITREALEGAVIPAAEEPLVYVCGSTGFVERVADWLVELGHDPRSIRTERYGGT